MQLNLHRDSPRNEIKPCLQIIFAILPAEVAKSSFEYCLRNVWNMCWKGESWASCKLCLECLCMVHVCLRAAPVCHSLLIFLVALGISTLCHSTDWVGGATGGTLDKATCKVYFARRNFCRKPCKERRVDPMSSLKTWQFERAKKFPGFLYHSTIAQNDTLVYLVSNVAQALLLCKFANPSQGNRADEVPQSAPKSHTSSAAGHTRTHLREGWCLTRRCTLSSR